jgi:hypothetical protein
MTIRLVVDNTGEGRQGADIDLLPRIERRLSKVRWNSKELDRAAMLTGEHFPDREATYHMLVACEQARQYRHGWARHHYRNLYGAWPERADGDVLVESSGDLLAWVEASYRAWLMTRPVPQWACRA